MKTWNWECQDAHRKSTDEWQKSREGSWILILSNVGGGEWGQQVQGVALGVQ